MSLNTLIPHPRRTQFLTCSGLLAVALTAFCQPAPAQESQDAPSIFSDPRLKSALRRVKDTSEEVATSAPDSADVDSMVKDAARKFSEEAAKIDTSKIDTPENRAKAQEVATEAAAKLTEAMPEIQAAVAEIPATRPPGPEPSAPPVLATPVAPADLPDETVENTDTVMQQAVVEVVEDAEPTATIIPDTPLLAVGNVPAPQKLTPQYDTRPARSTRVAGADQMEILAQKAEFDQNVLVFAGDVVVTHPDGQIKCDKLEIQLEGNVSPTGGSDTGTSWKRAIATGGLVEIKRTVEDESSTTGKKTKTQMAIGRRAEFTQLTGDFVLSGGPPYIQDGGTFIETTSADAKIIMRGNGKYEVTGSSNRQRIVIPIEGGDKTKDIGLGGGTGSGLNRMR